VPATPALRAIHHVAAVALAATFGALVGFGMRLRAPAALFAAAGDRLRGVPAFVAPERGVRASATLGVLHHMVLALVWSALFALVARRARGGALVACAAIAGVAIVLLDGALPAPLRFAGGAMTLAQRVVYGVVLAVALGAGMRLAQRDAASM